MAQSSPPSQCAICRLCWIGRPRAPLRRRRWFRLSCCGRSFPAHRVLALWPRPATSIWDRCRRGSPLAFAKAARLQPHRSPYSFSTPPGLVIGEFESLRGKPHRPLGSRPGHTPVPPRPRGSRSADDDRTLGRLEGVSTPQGANEARLGRVWLRSERGSRSGLDTDRKPAHRVTK